MRSSHTYEQRSNALALIVRDVARWQAAQGAMKDDAEGRALFEDKVREVQRRLVREYRVAEDLPPVVVTWEGSGRRAPVLSWAPEPMPPETLKARDQIFADLEREDEERRRRERLQRVDDIAKIEAIVADKTINDEGNFTQLRTHRYWLLEDFLPRMLADLKRKKT